MCCSTRRRRSLRASEDTPPQWLPLPPSPTGGRRGARQAATGLGRATGRRPTAPSGSPLPRRKEETRRTPTAAAAPRPRSRRPPPRRTAAASGRDGRPAPGQVTRARALLPDAHPREEGLSGRPLSRTASSSTLSQQIGSLSPHGGRTCAPRLRVRVCVCMRACRGLTASTALL